LFEQLTTSVRSVELENRYLRELLRLERIAKYGKELPPRGLEGECALRNVQLPS
jgi:hypothetical protein